MKKTGMKLFILILAVTILSVSIPMAHALDKSKSIPEEVQKTIDLLNASNNGIPDSVTKEEFQRVIREGGQAGIDAIEHICETATPVVAPTVTSEDIQSFSAQIQHFSYGYNMETGVETRIDGSEFDREPIDSPIKNDQSFNNGQQVIPYAYPTDWYSDDPQNHTEERSTCRLIIKAEYGTWIGTGFMISNKDLVTAGHCIWDMGHSSNGWPEFITVIPSASQSNPNGVYGQYGDTTSIEVGGDYKNNRDWRDDWGMMHLTQNPDCGYYTPMNPGDKIAGWWVRAQGYSNSGLRLRNTGGNVLSVNGRAMHISAKVYGGMSGGPVMEDTDKRVIGIIHGNYADNEGAIIRIDNWLYNKFMSYR